MSSPDYPGAELLAANMRRRWPWLSRQQAYIMACVKIRPDRNASSVHVGWDAMRRPVFHRKEYGHDRLTANLKNGNPTDPKYPITWFDGVKPVTDSRHARA